MWLRRDWGGEAKDGVESGEVGGCSVAARGSLRAQYIETAISSWTEVSGDSCITKHSSIPVLVLAAMVGEVHVRLWICLR